MRGAARRGAARPADLRAALSSSATERPVAPPRAGGRSLARTRAHSARATALQVHRQYRLRRPDHRTRYGTACLLRRDARRAVACRPRTRRRAASQRPTSRSPCVSRDGRPCARARRAAVRTSRRVPAAPATDRGGENGFAFPFHAPRARRLLSVRRAARRPGLRASAPRARRGTSATGCGKAATSGPARETTRRLRARRAVRGRS